MEGDPRRHSYCRHHGGYEEIKLSDQIECSVILRIHPVAKMTLKKEGIRYVLESLNGGDGEWKSQSTSHLDDIGLYREGTEDLSFPTRAPSSFVKSPD